MKRDSQGFTLVELLVVIAIIALLVSILLPSLKRAREMAARAVCGSTIKGLGTTLHLYSLLARYLREHLSPGPR